ncbi:MAG: M50 family metallopeptidase [Ignavibacteriales bacterium]
MQGVFWAVAGVALLMFFHELGHFLAAKASGMNVLEFSLGFGPRIASFKFRETQYSLRLIPLWAYAGMEEHSDPPGRGYFDKSVWARMGSAIGGPAGSLLLAAVLFTVTFSFVGMPHPTTVIDQVLPGYPAEAVGLQKGDRITRVNGAPVTEWESVSQALRGSPGTKVRLTVMRGGEEKDIDVVPSRNQDGTGVVGIVAASEIRREGVLRGIRDGFMETLLVGKAWIQALVQVITGRVAAEIIGPVGIGQMIAEASTGGLWNALLLIGMYSAVIGLANLLPVPMLDGGKIAFLIVEAVRGRPVDPEKEGLVHAIGFVVLFALAILVTFRDIQRLFT